MDELYTSLTRGVRKPKHKVALFLCGSSGTGKTSSVRRVLRDAGLKTTFVYLNADNIRSIASDYYKVRSLAFRVMKDGYSIVWDKTCRNFNETYHELTEFKNHGYRTIVSMIYADVNTVVKRVANRVDQPVPEDFVRLAFRQLRAKAEGYLKLNVIDELFLYNNEHTLTLIFHREKKHVTCLSPKSKFYFDISEYC